MMSTRTSITVNTITSTPTREDGPGRLGPAMLSTLVRLVERRLS